MINELDIEKLSEIFSNAKPFNHVVIDNFIQKDIADEILSEFPSWNSSEWNVFYDNQIEVKKALNHWDKFKATTYRFFNYMNSDEFLNKVKMITRNENLTTDIGLHGGGYHCHGPGGKLNVHLDYDIHPKLLQQRKLNIIVYMNKEWDDAWGGGLSLWSGTETKPEKCEKIVSPKFNRAILFDTTQNSWHGLPDEIVCPENESRKSLAIYYLQPAYNLESRKRAIFVPSEKQIGNKEIEDFCERRSKIK